MITINLERARTLLAEAVKTQGRDFVYNPGGEYECEYTPVLRLANEPERPNQKTGCLIGVALSLAGVNVKTLCGSVSLSAAEWKRGGVVDLQGFTAEYFRLAQREQDAGSTWGDAFDTAERMGT
jgi:hypothetical protein